MPPFLLASSYHILAACSASRPNAASWPGHRREQADGDLAVGDARIGGLRSVADQARRRGGEQQMANARQAFHGSLPRRFLSVAIKPSDRLHSVKPRASRTVRSLLRALVVCRAAIARRIRWRIGNSVYKRAHDPRCHAPSSMSRVALVTGAASGIGAAVTRALAADGFAVAADRPPRRAVPDGRDRREPRSSGRSRMSRQSSAGSACSSPAPAR